jgi:phosphatidylserine/phosphatidylglycerophosphate/cardiolipin synthase-like enzyme
MDSPTTLVATQPEHLVSAMPTLDAFRFVIAAANERLRVASPFLESSGLPYLSYWLKRAASRGVELTMLTRAAGGSPTVGAAIADLRTWYGPRLHVASYHVSTEGRQRLSLHAKLVIADETLAYVGSAEIRKHSLELNFELGVLMCCSVADLVRLFDGIAALRTTP